MRCSYKKNGLECAEEAFESGDYCILHKELPSETDEEFQKIAALKNEKANSKITEGDFSFQGARLATLHIPANSIIEGNVNFTDASIITTVWDDVTIRGDLFFDNTKLGSSAVYAGPRVIIPRASFNKLKVTREVFFKEAKFLINASFKEMETGATGRPNSNEIVDKDAWFSGATFDGNADFSGVKIRGTAKFNGITAKANVILDDACINIGAEFESAEITWLTSFERAIIGKRQLKHLKKMGEVAFDEATVGDINFEDATIDGSITFNPTVHRTRRTTVAGINFNDSTISGSVSVSEADINGGLSLNFKELGGRLDFDNVAFANASVAEKAYRKASFVYSQKGEEEKARYYSLRKREVQIQQIDCFGKRSGQRFFFYLFANSIYPNKAALAWLTLVGIYAIILLSMINLRDNLPFLAVDLAGCLVISLLVGNLARLYR